MILAKIRRVLDANKNTDKLPVRGIRIAAAIVFAVHEGTTPDDIGG